jgi:diamine N-acetyltransferase
MLEKRVVLRDHVADLIALDVRPDQRDLVTANVKTLAEAPYEPGAQVWGLWVGETPVGLMAMVDPRVDPMLYPDDDPEAAYLWRLMIAADHQGRGYGHAAVALAVAVTRDWGLPRMSSGVADLDHANHGFYARLGFRPTGKVAWGDRLITLNLNDFAPPGQSRVRE